MATSKELLAKHLLRPEQCDTTMTVEDMKIVMEKYANLASSNIKNAILNFKHIGRTNPIDGICQMRGCTTWPFVLRNMFPGQSVDDDKVFVFKMSEVGPASDLDLVTRMQPGGDLQDSWLMFDHMKHVNNWTTIACHIYDSQYCRVMTVVVCNMQFEDCELQCVMWRCLNEVMARYGLLIVNFKGFMADSAGANWNAIHKIYATGDPHTKMPNREHTCLLHWTTSMNHHTIISRKSSKNSIISYASNTKIRRRPSRLRFHTLQFGHGGSHVEPWTMQHSSNLSSGLIFGIIATDNGEPLCRR